MKFRYAIYCGRFQPPHYGHIASLKLGLKYAQKVCIGIRNTDPPNFKNPLTVQERIKLWELICEELSVSEQVIIKEIPDIPKHIITDDKIIYEKHPLIQWVKEVEKIFGTSPKHDVFIGNKPHMVIAFNLAGYIVIPAHRNLYRLIDVSATELRNLIITGSEKWKEMLPKVVVDFLVKINIEKRLKKLKRE